MKKNLKNKNTNLKPLLISLICVGYAIVLLLLIFWVLRLLYSAEIIDIPSRYINNSEYAIGILGLAEFVISVIFMAKLKNSNVGCGKISKKAILITNAIIQSLLFVSQLLVGLRFAGIDVLPWRMVDIEKYMWPCIMVVTLIISIVNTVALVQMKNNKNKKR